MNSLLIIPLSTWSTLDQVRGAVLAGRLGAVGSIASVLAAMMAAVVLLKTASDYIQGQGVGIWQLVRPLVLLLLVCQFNTLVLSPLNALANVFTRDLAATVSVSTGDYVSRWGENMLQMEKYNIRANDEDSSAALEEISKSDRSPAGKFFMTLFEGVKKFLRNLFSVTTLTIGGVVGGILFLVVKVLLFAQQVLCSLYLTIAGLLGPVVFALSIPGAYAGGIRNWVARYVQIAMWVPVGYLVMYINLQVGSAFLGMAAAGGDTGLASEWFMIALQVVSLVSVASVPKIAGWVIESTGANDAHASVTQPFRQIARKLM